MHLNGYSLRCRHPQIFLNYHYFRSMPSFPSKIQISFGLSGKCKAKIARLDLDETTFCFCGEVFALWLAVLFSLKIHLEETLRESLASLKIFLPFLFAKSCSPKTKRASCHLEEWIVCLVNTKWSQSCPWIFNISSCFQILFILLTVQGIGEMTNFWQS